MADKFGHIRRNRQDKCWSWNVRGTTGSSVYPDGAPTPIETKYNFNCLLSDNPNIQKYFYQRKLNVGFLKREFIAEAANLFEEIAHDSTFLLEQKQFSPMDDVQVFAKRNSMDLLTANNFFRRYHETIESAIRATKNRVLHSSDAVIENHLFGGSLGYRELNFGITLSWKPMLEPVTEFPEKIAKCITILD